MVHLPESGERTQSTREEIANSVSHGIGLLAAVAAVPFLLNHSINQGSATGLFAASVFAITMVLLYLISTIYHALPATGAKKVFQLLDHGAIYLLIAGTYTPFTLGVLSGAWGQSLFVVIWMLALSGVFLKITTGLRHRKLSLFLYLSMGWLVLVAIKPLWLSVPAWGLFWLVAGGIAYTSGLAFYIATHRPYYHFIWHIFVMLGTSCHYIAVLQYAA